MFNKIINRFAVIAVMITCLSLSFAIAQESGDIQSKLDRIYNSSQRDYNKYKKDIQAEVLDNSFTTKEAMYLANEMILSGTYFFDEAIKSGIPVVNDKDFFNITSVEAYWYSRYNLSNLFVKSRMGVSLVHGPYLTLKSIEQKDNVFYNRNRGERELANREVLLGQIIPLYLKRTGFARRFENASPIMLEFASGDPRLPGDVDINDDFEGGNGKPDFEDDYLTLRWNESKMNKTIDFGAVGQSLVKETLWIEYFFSQNHDNGKLLGNDAEEGFRGAMLNLGAVSKMLLLKSALFYDGDKLTGINPANYDPNKKILYIPHNLSVRLIKSGDIPPRPEWYNVEDKTSQLFDQASMLWGTSEYFYFSDPNIEDNWNKVFGDNTPYDGSIMEQKYATALSSGLSDVLIKNITKTHWSTKYNSLVSTWDPEKGLGTSINTMDAGMAMIALANYYRHCTYSSELMDQTKFMLRAQADFFLNTLQNKDGSFADGYDFNIEQKITEDNTLLSQGIAIRGLIEAYKILNDQNYWDSTLKAYDFMNKKLWNEQTGVYTSTVGALESLYNPSTIAATLGAMREIILKTKDLGEVERFKQFFVQGVDRSGIMLAEESNTGETDVDQVDGDNDGIPQFQFAGYGKTGVAAVYASKVLIKTPSSSINKEITKK